MDKSKERATPRVSLPMGLGKLRLPIEAQKLHLFWEILTDQGSFVFRNLADFFLLSCGHFFKDLEGKTYFVSSGRIQKIIVEGVDSFGSFFLNNHSPDHPLGTRQQTC